MWLIKVSGVCVGVGGWVCVCVCVCVWVGGCVNETENAK